jgi:hypothetical protein
MVLQVIANMQLLQRSVMSEMSRNWCNHMRDVAIGQNSEQMPVNLFITQYIAHTIVREGVMADLLTPG